MEIINKSDEKLLAEYEQFASTSKYGNFMQSLKWPKVKDNWGWDAVISRDAAGKFLDSYYKAKIYESDPFARLEQTGVGRLVELSVMEGRATRLQLKCGICGEHGGDPSSVEFCNKIGLDYVSCSPFRVPIARLAAAQAVLKDK